MPDMQTEVTLSIVIINFRTPKLVTKCIASVLPELENLDSRVVLVDNYSQDSSVQDIRHWLKKHDADSKVLFIQSDKNAGFSAGNNIGIKAQKAKYYLLLNSDTIMRSGTIQVLIDTIIQNQKTGLVSPRLEWMDGLGQESCFRSHSVFSEFMAAAQTGFIDNLLKSFVVAMPVQSEINSPEWTSFACVLIRQEVFNEIGLLDEGYFMYYEDSEFCHRATKSGWHIINNPNVGVVHLRGGSSPLKEDMKKQKCLPKYFYESRTRYFYQTNSHISLIIANIMWETGRLISKARQIAGRKDKATIENQWIDIWTNVLSPLKKYTHPGKLE